MKDFVCLNNEPVVLGKGGWGLVLRAFVGQEEAAVKMVLGGSTLQNARLLHEISILEQCKSSHITRFLGYSVSNDGLLLLMEFMPGGNLAHSLKASTEFQWYNRSVSTFFFALFSRRLSL